MHSLHKQIVPEMALCVNNLERMKCFISYRKAWQAERQLSKWATRPLEVNNTALLNACPRINRAYFRFLYHERTGFVQPPLLSFF